METNEFEVKTAAFLSWLSEVGVVSSKIQVADLRATGRGRGVGTFLYLLSCHR
jgi:hypothetical protein